MEPVISCRGREIGNRNAACRMMGSNRKVQKGLRKDSMVRQFRFSSQGGESMMKSGALQSQGKS